jgi:hypothetical protein
MAAVQGVCIACLLLQALSGACLGPQGRGRGTQLRVGVVWPGKAPGSSLARCSSLPSLCLHV